MAASALSVLSQNKNGFFLMLESGLVDWIGHRNRSFSSTVPEKSAAFALGAEFAELNRTLDLLLAFLNTHPDTLIVVTADHETGGLVVDEAATTCLGQNGCLPALKWTSPLKDTEVEPIANHTGVNVEVHAIGKNASAFAGTDLKPMDNTEFVTRIFGSPTPGND
jgi:alkaline phosphatase